MRSPSSQSLQRFEHGRHETFAIRHGWLGKGIARIECSGGFQTDLGTADALGLGSKMIKSLSYWLEASGLACAGLQGRSRQLSISPMGAMIARRDPYFEFPASWWSVHASLATREGSVFGWFFNDFQERRFDRLGCIDAFHKYLRERASKQPSLEAVQRDVACLLASYADELGKLQDPEDATVCPLTELGLLTWHRDTGRFERTSPPDQIPLEVFLGVASRLGRAAGTEAVSIGEMAARRHGLGRVLNMRPDAIDAAAVEAAHSCGRYGVTFELLGAERRLRAGHRPPEYWLELHYDRIGAAG
jgi:hypothetical protein